MSYPEGSLGYDLAGRRLRLLDAFIEKRMAAESEQLSAEEAMSVADFPTYLGAFIRTTFLGTFDEVQGAWAQYTHGMAVPDFEEYTSYRWGRFPNWQTRPLNSDVEQAGIKEYPGPSVKLIEWAQGFAIDRQLMLADRLNRIMELPQRLAEAGARTVSTRAVAQLEANPTMYDGYALFENTHHGNIGSTALTADLAGVNLIKAAIDAIENQTDDEGYKIATAGGTFTLIVPRALQWIAYALRDRDLLPYAVATADAVLRPNELAHTFEVVVERFLTDANNWYVALNPTGPQGFLAAVTLNGNTRPYIGQKDDHKIGLLGNADDPYSFRFDRLEYMGRHDFDFLATEYRTVYGAIVSP